LLVARIFIITTIIIDYRRRLHQTNDRNHMTRAREHIDKRKISTSAESSAFRADADNAASRPAFQTVRSVDLLQSIHCDIV
jgi:hypothetical protein